MLVVLWCNYVPGTWGARRTPWAPLSPEQRRGYLQLVRDTFADLQPVLVVSGDEHFHDDEPVAAYAEVLATVKELAPGCLTTLHTTPDADLPAVLAESDALDIYVYQSGHDAERQARAHELAELHLAKRRRPIMNVEPCYEAHGHGGGRGRFTDRDVRRATWWSLLGGASAGIGYGAHGVWQWHRTGATFTNAPFSMEPLTWRAALELPGAWDVGWARGVVEDAGLVGALPRQDLLRGAAHGVRLAQGEGGALAAYTPFAQAFTLSDELEVEQVVAWDLERRRRVHLDVRREADGLRVAQADTPGDLLVLVNRP